MVIGSHINETHTMDSSPFLSILLFFYLGLKFHIFYYKFYMRRSFDGDDAWKRIEYLLFPAFNDLWQEWREMQLLYPRRNVVA